MLESERSKSLTDTISRLTDERDRLLKSLTDTTAILSSLQTQNHEVDVFHKELIDKKKRLDLQESQMESKLVAKDNTIRMLESSIKTLKFTVKNYIYSTISLVAVTVLVTYLLVR